MRRVIFCLTLLISGALLAPAMADAPKSAASSRQLAQLEVKYFEHSFDTDSTDSRVARLEKMIYGDERTGPTADRLSKLLTLVEKEEEVPLPSLDPPSAPPKTQVAAVAPKAGKPGATSGAAPSSRTDSTAVVPSVENGDFSNYPHINVLEDEILGREFAQDSLPSRLSRLETAVFGKTFASQDFSSRTDALEQFAESKLHKKPFAVNPKMGSGDENIVYDDAPPVAPSRNTMPVDYHEPDGFGQTPQFSDQPPATNEKMINKVEWCEYHVFGKTFPSLHLMARLRQLHDALAPDKSESNLQLMDDMDSLTKAVEARIAQKSRAR